LYLQPRRPPDRPHHLWRRRSPARRRPAGPGRRGLHSSEPVIIGDLLADPRWAGPDAPPPAEANAEPLTNSNGANGHEPTGPDAEAEALPAAPVAANGQYHSSLALPVRPTGANGAHAGPAGVLLFFSTRPAAFAPEALPVAAAAASQIAYTLERDARLQDWAMQATALRDHWPAMKPPSNTPPAEPVVTPVAPVGVKRSASCRPTASRRPPCP
jgi:hypothetical protein